MLDSVYEPIRLKIIVPFFVLLTFIGALGTGIATARLSIAATTEFDAGPTPTGLPLPTPSGLPLPTPSALPIPTPTGLPLPTPTGLPLPTPSGLPLPAPPALPLPTPSLPVF